MLSANTDKGKKGLNTGSDFSAGLFPVNPLDYNHAPAPEFFNPRDHGYNVVVVKRTEVCAGKLGYREVHTVFVHKAAIGKTQVAEEIVASNFKKMKIIAMIDAASNVDFVKRHTENSSMGWFKISRFHLFHGSFLSLFNFPFCQRTYTIEIGTNLSTNFI
jgi:hypothetical protein